MIPTEHDEQKALVQWATLEAAGRPELRMLFAIPNGGDRSPIVGAKLKAEGVKPGVPDLFLAVPMRSCGGLFIEMKKRKGGRTSPHQKQWISDLKAHRYAARVCNGWEEARDAILEYLDGPREAAA
jgi:hypothetical protein